jgi:hypothetical protein
MGRGRAQKSVDIIDAMYNIARECNPITGRGVGYKLFIAKLIDSMSRNNMQTVYRLLKEAREEGVIPWDWITDESRELEQVSTWEDAQAYARAVTRSYRIDFWKQQDCRVEIWSEKGTVRGVLQPVLDEYAVGFRVMHGFSSATVIHDVADHGDGRDLNVLYVGDYDPSGMFMSEEDLPNRIAKYGGDHITVNRIALTSDQVTELPSFPVTDKKKDTRYDWFVDNFGKRCWELDAFDPNDLRACVEEEIKSYVEPVAWERCEVVNAAELESLRTVMGRWCKGKKRA